jgi:putative glutamine amidotransferase
MATLRPIIGITSYGPEGELPSFHLPRRYVDAVVAAGGIPVVLCASALPVEETLGAVDGLVFAGGGDISPEAWGGDPHETVYSVNHTRDDFELRLIRAALERPEVPVVGICRGMQVMNIALGGDLEVHLPDVYGERVLHRLPPRLPTTHEVSVEPVGLFGEIFPDKKLDVASWHHQSIRKLGRGLVPTAHAEDGVIEGVLLEDHPFALGVQWHPEMQQEDPRQLRLFQALVTRARERKRRSEHG